MILFASVRSLASHLTSLSIKPLLRQKRPTSLFVIVPYGDFIFKGIMCVNVIFDRLDRCLHRVQRSTCTTGLWLSVSYTSTGIFARSAIAVRRRAPLGKSTARSRP